MKVKGIKKDYVTVDIRRIDAIDAIIKSLGFYTDDNDSYIDISKDGSSLVKYEETSTHGSTNYKVVETISKKEDDIELFKCLITAKVLLYNKTDEFEKEI